jgi:uncharacterized repeat protein (TIGR01451 family)
MRRRESSTGCIPQILAVIAILACVIGALLAFGVLRLRPLRSGDIKLEAMANPSTAKVGDVVTYTVTMYNVEVRDGLDILTVTDSLLGDLSGAFVSTLAEGTSDRAIFTRTVQLSDPDPLTSTVSVYAEGADQVFSDSAIISVDLLKPVVRIDTTVEPATAARGETVTYTVSVANVGEIPVEVITVTDSLLGDLTEAFAATLAPGATEAQSFEWEVPSDEADPLDRTVTLYATGVGEVVSHTATAEVALLRPAVEVAAAVSPAAAVPGQAVTYTVTISNVGRIDLETLRVTDSEAGDLSPPFARTLLAGTVERHTFAWSIPSDAVGPLSRTVTVDAAGGGQAVSDSASADLVLAELQVAASGSRWVREGEPVTYTVTITNTSASVGPDLILDQANDAEGELTAELPEACRTLVSGESCTFSYDTVTPAGGDSMTNIIEVRYRPEGFDAAVVGVARHTTQIFQISIAVEKSGPALSETGERASYVVDITNTSSAAAPDLIFEAALDSQGNKLTVPDACGVLGAGERCSFSYDALVPSGEDPLTTEVEVQYRPEGFMDVVSAVASHTVEIFQPSVAVSLSGDGLSLAEEVVTHQVIITNTSSEDAPNLILERAADSRTGELTVPGACRLLVSGDVCTFSYDVVVPPNEDPLATRVEVRYRPEGFEGLTSAAASHTVEIFQPSVTVGKSGPELGVEGDEMTYTVEIANTGSDDAPDLILDTIIDDLRGDLTREGDGVTATCPERLGSGERCQITYAYTPSAADPRSLENTVRVEGRPLGFDAVVAASADHTVSVVAPWEQGVGTPARVEVWVLEVCSDDPDVLYAGFGIEADGVYRSQDGGASWVETALQNENAEVFGLAVDPDDCDTVYAAAWRDGVRKSEDGGRTWDASPSGPEDAFVYNVVIDPVDPDMLYAGTAERGVFRSDDAGATWRTWSLDALTVPYLSVASDGQVVYAATWGDGVYRRGRVGARWSEVNDGIPAEHHDVYAVAVDPEDRSIVFAATASGGVYRTLNNGGTWERVLPSPEAAFAVAVAPGPNGMVYAGTADGLYRSGARGDPRSWEPFNGGLDGLAVRSLALGPEGALYLGTTDGVWRRPR